MSVKQLISGYFRKVVFDKNHSSTLIPKDCVKALFVFETVETNSFCLYFFPVNVYMQRLVLKKTVFLRGRVR